MAHVSHTQPKVALPKDDGEKQLVLEYVELVFSETFGFDFPSDTSFAPPGAATPPDLHVSENEATLQNARPQDVQEFLTTALSALKLPSWLQGDASKDLLNLSSTILEAATDQWLFVSLAKVYTPSDLATANPVKADVIVVFFTGLQDVKGQPTKTTELGLAAVYFDLLPSLDWARFQLRLSAYRAAGVGLADGKKVVRDDKSLTDVAKGFSELEFTRDFSYKWGGNPPDFVNSTKYKKAEGVALGYFEDGKTDKMQAFVKDKVLKGAPVPSWAEDGVVKALVDANVTNLSISPDTRTWSARKYDQTYDDPNGHDGSFRINGVLVSYTISQALRSHQTVQVAYVFWLGETYTIPALKSTAYNDMITDLYNHLHSAMSSIPTSGLKSDKAGLLELLHRCGKAKFESYSGYDFQDKNTKPTKSNGEEVYAVACFGEFDATVTDAAISDWTTKNIFEPGSFSFFPSVPQIQSDLNARVMYWLTQSSSNTRDNSWGVAKFPQAYDHPTSSSKLLASDAAVFYANGAKSEGGLVVKSNMIFFMGVYYVADNSNDGSDEDEI